MIQGPGARSTDVERDESLIANRGGFSFLFVHGWTWIAAAALTFVLPIKVAALVYLFQGFVAFPLSLLLERRLGYKTLSTKENSLVSLFVLIAVAQGFALPASIVVYNLEPALPPGRLCRDQRRALPALLVAPSNKGVRVPRARRLVRSVRDPRHRRR